MQSNDKALNVTVKPITKIKEAAAKYTFLLCGLLSIIAIAVICIFLFGAGIPAIMEIGLFKFLFGMTWNSEVGQFGILPMIVGSLYITAGSLIVGVPLGIMSAAFITYFCPKKIKAVVKQVVSLLVGIPSIIYGFFGIQVLLPYSTKLARFLGYSDASGTGVLLASVVLGIMILPTVINLSAASIEAIPKEYYEGALALGATHEQAVFKVVIPAAKSGIFTAVALGMGRAIGETMAVAMVAGNYPWIPPSIFHPVLSMTAAVVVEMGYAVSGSLHYQALISIALVLFVFILILNISVNLFRQKNIKGVK